MKEKYCTCKECENCCKQLPGIPLSNEVEKIADFLKIPLVECLEKYFIVGWRSGIKIKKKDYEIKFVYPAKIGWNNKRESWAYPFENISCIFLQKNLCMINEVKPYECLKEFGCREAVGSKDVVLLQWDKVWKENTINQVVKKFIEEHY